MSNMADILESEVHEASLPRLTHTTSRPTSIGMANRSRSRESSATSRSSQAQIDLLYGSVVSTIIEDRLYLSGGEAALNEELIVDILGITHIVNASNGAVANKFSDSISYISINIDDSEAGEESIYNYFDLVSDFLDESETQDTEAPSSHVSSNLEGSVLTGNEKRILFHCLQGVSRSATLLIAYLMKSDGMTLREAFELAKSKRSKVRPNGDFADALIKYEKKLYPDSPGTASLFSLTGSRQKPNRMSTSTSRSSTNNPMLAGRELSDFASSTDKSTNADSSVEENEKAKSRCCIIS